jgi:tRNA threonylcarbamoyladenosine biosynthesis protein TsaE
MEIITASVKETQSLAKKIAKVLRGGEVFALTGDLGAGKTAFVQGLAQGLGIRRPVTSPSFVILKEYQADVLKLYHFDFYRISSIEEAFDLGLEEVLAGKKNVVLVEWPEKAPEALPEEKIEIKFDILSENMRSLRFSCSKKFKYICKSLS